MQSWNRTDAGSHSDLTHCFATLSKSLGLHFLICKTGLTLYLLKLFLGQNKLANEWNVLSMLSGTQQNSVTVPITLFQR